MDIKLLFDGWEFIALGITYSSDARLVAATSDDGCLRVIDALQES